MMPTLIALQLLPIFKAVEVGPHVAPTSGKALAPSTQAGRLHRICHVKLLHLQRRQHGTLETAVFGWWLPTPRTSSPAGRLQQRVEQDCRCTGNSHSVAADV